MADQKVTALTATTTMATTDLFYVVKDAATVPVSRKMTLQSVANMLTSIFSGTYGLSDGWATPLGETWTYASAVTFTVPNDMTTRYSKGTKLKLTQTTDKYFYVIASSYGAPNTTVTVTGGTDYTLANAAITNPYYSYAVNPVGFPGYFSYTPTWTGSSTNPAVVNGTLAGHFMIVGKRCQVVISLSMGASTTYGTGTYAFALPVAVSATALHDYGNMQLRDTGVKSYPRMVEIAPSGTTVATFLQLDNDNNVTTIGPTTPFTFANGDLIRMSIGYEI